jgi:multiple antibiotic resistance protein
LVLVVFLFVGEGILSLFSVDILSFALAGSFVIFLLALEMVLNIEIFKPQNIEGDSVVPLVFPLIAGAGSLTTLLSLRSQYNEINIIIGIFLNIVVVYIVLRLTNSIEKLLGQSGIYILRKIFGIILLAVAIKLFLSSTGLDLAK